MQRTLNISVSSEPSRELYLQCHDRLGPILEAVQSEEYIECGAKKRDQRKKKLMDEVENIACQVGLKVFSETLFRMMVIPFQAKDSVYVRIVIDFFLDLITDERWGSPSPSSSPLDPNTSMASSISINMSMVEDTNGETLPLRILRLCEKYHGETRPLVRTRIMKTIEKLIPDRVSVKEILGRRPLAQKIVRMLLQRRKDKCEHVRVSTASILCALWENPSGSGRVPSATQVLEAILLHMSSDPEPAVRAKMVSKIPLTEDTIPPVVERTGDPSPVVRAAAINRLATDTKVHNLNLEMREAILKANAVEDAPKNVQTALSGLLESWLRTLENDPCEFVRILNVRTRPKLCHTALDNLFKNMDPEEAFEKIRGPILKDKMYPEECLCVESTFLWLYLFRKFKDNAYLFKKLSFPATDMITYIKEFLEVVEEEGELSITDYNYRAWLLGDMLQILQYLPVEEGERKACLEFLPTLYLQMKLMDTRNCALGVQVISVCSDIRDETAVIQIVNAVIDSDVRKWKNGGAISTKMELDSGDFSNMDDLKNKAPGIDELSTLTSNLKRLQRQRDIAVMQEDLRKAKELQDEVAKLEARIKDTKGSISSASDTLNCTMTSEFPDDEELWHYSDKTMLIAMSTVKTNMLMLNKISDFSRTFYEMYVLKAVVKANSVAVRSLALEIMTIVAIDFDSESPKAATFCLTALVFDVLEVKKVALKCLYDLVLCYSFKRFGDSEEVQAFLTGEKSKSKLPTNIRDLTDTTGILKTLMFSYISHEDRTLVKITVAGVLKLLFKKEMNTTRIITKFLYNWGVPVQESQARFKDVSLMIPIYASLGEEEAVEVANCLVQCVKNIIGIVHSRRGCDQDQIPPPNSDRIINLVVTATDPSRLTQFQRPYVAHEAIANATLQELGVSDLTTEEKLQYVRLLKVLNITQCPVSSLKQMLDTTEHFAEQSNKTVNQTLVGFMKHLESIIGTSGEGDKNETTLAGAGAFDDEDVTMIQS